MSLSHTLRILLVKKVCAIQNVSKSTKVTKKLDKIHYIFIDNSVV
jgi:hypothetical protein